MRQIEFSEKNELYFQVLIINSVKPGIPCSELCRVGMAVFKRSGFGDLVTSTSAGHGIGLHNYEMSILSRDNDQPLVDGTVIWVEPWHANQELRGLNLEDMVIVRKHGAELTTTDLRETTPVTKIPNNSL